MIYTEFYLNGTHALRNIKRQTVATETTKDKTDHQSIRYCRDITGYSQISSRQVPRLTTILAYSVGRFGLWSLVS